MYRKPSGHIGFSFNRLITNAVPNFANSGSASDADLTPKQQDDLFRWQLFQPDPKILNEKSFYLAGIVENPSQSPRILSSLLKHSILLPQPPYVQTTLITKQFPHQLPFLSLHRQRRLVSLLFFWEEELVRWRLLEDEEAEIAKLMSDLGEEEEGLQVALEVVRKKMRVLPAGRGEERGALPEYGEVGGSVGVLAGPALQVGPNRREARRQRVQETDSERQRGVERMVVAGADRL